MARSKFEQRFKIESRETTLEDAISCGYSDVGDLADEMEEWRDSIPENLQGSDKYSAIEEAFDVLNDNRDEPNIDEALNNLKVSYSVISKRYKSRSGISRSVRLDNALSYLSGIIDTLQEEMDRLDEIEDRSDDDNSRFDLCQSLQEEVQNTIDNLDGRVEFPGMFG